MSTQQTESILDTLTDDERQAAEGFIRQQRETTARREAGESLVNDFIQRRNEAGAGKPNPLDGARGPYAWRG